MPISGGRFFSVELNPSASDVLSVGKIGWTPATKTIRVGNSDETVSVPGGMSVSGNIALSAASHILGYGLGANQLQLGQSASTVYTPGTTKTARAQLGGGASYVASGSGATSSNAVIWGLANWSGAITGAGQQPLNRICVNGDTIAVSDVTNWITGLEIRHAFGGGSTAGGRHACVIYLNQNGATQTKATVGKAFNVGMNIFVDAYYNEGGTADNDVDSFGWWFCFNPVLRIHSGATYQQGCTVSEYNTLFESGCHVSRKTMIQFVQESGDAVQGSKVDTCALFTNQVGAVGWKTAIGFGMGVGEWPLSADGTLIKASAGAAGTKDLDCACGIDLEAIVPTDASLKLPGMRVLPDGDIVFTPDTTAPTLADGEAAIVATSNTTMTFYYRGSDSTLRSGAIATLS